VRAWLAPDLPGASYGKNEKAVALPLWMGRAAAELLLPEGREYHEVAGRSCTGGIGMKIVRYGLLLFLGAGLTCATAGLMVAQNTQQQQDPLAAAARRVREQQKSQAKPARVWDNDNIPTSGGVAVIGTPDQAPQAGSSTPANAPAGKAGGSTAKEAESAKQKKSDLEAQLKAAKEDLKTAQTDVDFAQRKYKLDEQDFYQDPNYQSNTSGAAALQAEQGQIDAKKQAMQSAQEKVTDLESKLAKVSEASSASNDNSAK